RVVRAPDALRQGLLPRGAGGGGESRLAARHFRAPCADAATAPAGRIQLVLVLPRRGKPRPNAFGVSLGGAGRHSDSRVLAPLCLRTSLRLARRSPAVYRVHEAALRRARSLLSRLGPRRAGRRGCLRTGTARG